MIFRYLLSLIVLFMLIISLVNGVAGPAKDMCLTDCDRKYGVHGGGGSFPHARLWTRCRQDCFRVYCG